MERLKKWEDASWLSLLIISAGFFIVFFILSLTKAGIIADSDEALFHYPNVINFLENGWNALFNTRYSAANTPLPYIIVALAGKLFGPGLLLARIITALFSFGAFYFALRITRLSGVPAYYAFVIFFYPYFFNNAFVFYVINYGLFFILWAFYILKKNETNASYLSDLLAGTLFSLAILCQQFYIIIPAAVIFYRFTKLLANPGGVNTNAVGKYVLSSVLVLVPLAIPLLLFVKWGGLTHPNFNAHSLSFYPSTFVAILFVTGFYLFWFAWQHVRQFRLPEYAIAAALAILAVWKIPPVFSDQQGPGLFTGIAFHVITLTGKIAWFLPVVTMALLTFTGILVMMALARYALSGFEKLTAISIALLALGYALNTQIGERHLLGLVILLLLLILPRVKKPFVTGQLLWMALVGVGYFFYWTFIKFK